jgi:hypothetical protein
VPTVYQFTGADDTDGLAFAAILSVLGSAADMRRLGINHVWLPLTEWALLGAYVGAPAAMHTTPAEAP